MISPNSVIECHETGKSDDSFNFSGKYAMRMNDKFDVEQFRRGLRPVRNLAAEAARAQSEGDELCCLRVSGSYAEADFSGLDFDRVLFENCRFTKCSFNGCSFHTAAFADSDISNCDFGEARFIGCIFHGAKGVGTAFTGSRFEKTR